MRAYRAGRRLAALAVLLSCLTAATTGCAVDANNTSNTANGNCDGVGASNRPNCAQSQNASSTVLSTSAPPAASSAPPNGTQLAPTYSFDLPITYWAPLGLTAPTRAQLSNQSQLDIQYNGELYFGANDQVLALPNSSVPTYQACANNNQIENGGLGLNAVRGTAFCVVEGGTIAGVEVGSVNDNPAYVVLNVTIWQYT
jgi:hypothetical protein